MVVPSYEGVAWDPSLEGGTPGVEGARREGQGSMGVEISLIHHQAESMKCKEFFNFIPVFS